MSYEDKSVSELVAATAVNTPKYSNNYFYDGTSGLGSIRMYAGEQLSTVFVPVQETEKRNRLAR